VVACFQRLVRRCLPDDKGILTKTTSRSRPNARRPGAAEGWVRKHFVNDVGSFEPIEVECEKIISELALQLRTDLAGGREETAMLAKLCKGHNQLICIGCCGGRVRIYVALTLRNNLLTVFVDGQDISAAIARPVHDLYVSMPLGK
jgi:hypothetical protein